MNNSIIFFTDPGKDGDDLIATLHLLMQAKVSALLPIDTEIILVTTDEIPCDEKAVQKPNAKFGLRALYLHKQIEQLKTQFKLPTEAYPRIIAGPKTSHYHFNEVQQTFYDETSKSEAFYPNREMQDYFGSININPAFAELPSPDNASQWLEPLLSITRDGARLINISSFDALSELLELIPVKERPNLKIVTMGLNKPYSATEYVEQTKELKTLAYNERSTEVEKAFSVISTLSQIPSTFHVLSGTTRNLPKFDQNSWFSNLDVMARAYALYAGELAEPLLSSITSFLKQSKYKSFWPHDAVATLSTLLADGHFNSLNLPQLCPEMLFTSIESIPANQVRMRVVQEDTAVLIDASVPEQAHDKTIGTEDQQFTYGKELDVVFFTSLLNVLAIEALSEDKQPKLLADYKSILSLKAELFDLKKEVAPDVTRVQGVELEIQQKWNLLCLKELQQQLALQTQNELSSDRSYVLGSQANHYSLAKFTPQQANFLISLLEVLIKWAENGQPLEEIHFKWLKDFAEYMQAMQVTPAEYLLPEFNEALTKSKEDKKPLATFLFHCFRSSLMPNERARELLKQNGQLGLEFKRTGNSLMYAQSTLLGNLTSAFPKGQSGMSDDYKAMLGLSNHNPKQKMAFMLHLALHDAGKGDVIKKAVKADKDGNFLIRIDKNFFKVTENKELIAETSEEEFNKANGFVDHDEALVVYALCGSTHYHCSPTEFLLFGGPAPEDFDKEILSLCDQLLTLCDEINIAQTIQGEIPFEGIKRGLDLFFEAYHSDPKLADLVFAHHCYDIFGAAPLDSSVSITGNSPEIHLKIDLLYQTLKEVAQQVAPAEASVTAFKLYRAKLSQAIPEILRTEDRAGTPAVLALTRIAQTLRCHLFKTEVDEKGNRFISSQGSYDKRTAFFVEATNMAFARLCPTTQSQLIHFLNRNEGHKSAAAAMIIYAPKLFLTATTGGEFVKDPSDKEVIDPKDKRIVAECLVPMLELYHDLYALTAKRSKVYGEIEINNLTLIVEKMFGWYQQVDLKQKRQFASLLLHLQVNNLDASFCANLQDIKGKEPQVQFEALAMQIKAMKLPFRISCGRLESTRADQIVQAIHLESTKTKKQQELLKQINKANLTIEEFIDLYEQVRTVEALNSHRNPNFDRFFGIKNTSTWIDTLELFRNKARERLFMEVDLEPDFSAKISMLEQAKELKLFSEHRNNFWGTWRETTSLQLIDKKIATLKNHALNI
ncbi:hypothetical protein [Legionella jordanis]|uniref:Uncharacterized protein n=1 Tax=Legionella jordanis TaxID=456 RepID=A0A0W0VE79_9GAMM|nr:hypothetical protein [Legionella jordanis]KTD18386.1 hypothetical protein Ljor_2692 [Legionella jordanis]RMX05294.1 hypothetical protein EAW55_01125 [Legionella jordanis]VEH13268.1 Uncharacterised protein [Legionella jordanis]HAT8713617.1 hypothetical protein [Legionella jordanis]